MVEALEVLRFDFHREIQALRGELTARVDAFEFSWHAQYDFVVHTRAASSTHEQPRPLVPSAELALGQPRPHAPLQEELGLAVSKELALQALGKAIKIIRSPNVLAQLRIASAQLEAQLIIVTQPTLLTDIHGPWACVGLCYDRIRMAREESDVSSSEETDILKSLLIVVRDFLVVLRCYCFGVLDSDALRHCMTDVFQRPVDRQLMSECSLSYRCVMDLGDDKEVFDNHYAGKLDVTKLAQLFALYQHCAIYSRYTSKQQAAERKRPAKAAKRLAEAPVAPPQRTRSAPPAQRDTLMNIDVLPMYVNLDHRPPGLLD